MKKCYVFVIDLNGPYETSYFTTADSLKDARKKAEADGFLNGESFHVIEDEYEDEYFEKHPGIDGTMFDILTAYADDADDGKYNGEEGFKIYHFI